MVNGLAVLGWGVGGIEAEAVMLGQQISMLLPQVIGFKLTGRLKEGVTATDLVLTVTQMLRKRGVVGKFVEFYGPGLDDMTVADRATIANMAPEYGATCGFFPIDQRTIDYLTTTGRDPERVALVKAYAEAQGMWRTADTPDPVFTDSLHLDMTDVVPSLAGPKRPQDRVTLDTAKTSFLGAMDQEFRQAAQMGKRHRVEGEDFDLGHGDVVIAAITSCTNTSNPSVMLAAGLLARTPSPRGWAQNHGSRRRSHQVRRSSRNISRSPVSRPISTNLALISSASVARPASEIRDRCRKQSRKRSRAITSSRSRFSPAIGTSRGGSIRTCGRTISRRRRSSSPYALAGSMAVDLVKEPLGLGSDGKPVYLRDIWPSSKEVQDCIDRTIGSELFKARYSDVFSGDTNWKNIGVTKGQTYEWDSVSTYVQNPPYFVGMTREPIPPTDIINARILGMFLNSITTDHISPAGSIKESSPAGHYLRDHQIRVVDFNQYGTRRGNHEVMMRGTFANIRIKNQMVKDEAGKVVEGGYAIHQPSGERMSIYDAAMRYQADKVPLVVFAGKEYGTGSSRDWAAKGTNLLGIRAVIAESFERIHRSNLVGMGVMPLVSSRAPLGGRSD